MSAVPPPAPDLAQVRRRVFFGIFAMLAATAAVGGYLVVRESRARALQVDAALKVAAWGLLCHAHQEGRWPQSPEAFAAWADGRAPCASAGPGDGWPSSMPSDCAELTLQKALTSVAVSIDPAGSGPPVLSGAGRPSSVGTLDTVNGWIRARAAAGFVAHSAP